MDNIIIIIVQESYKKHGRSRFNMEVLCKLMDVVMRAVFSGFLPGASCSEQVFTREEVSIHMYAPSGLRGSSPV